jgi:uncharacterized RDD family membrane protein YckC
MKIVGFQKRIIAYLIDQLICFGISTGIYFALAINFPSFWGIVHIGSFFWIIVMESFIYFILMTFTSFIFNGYTFGTLICRYKNISLKSDRISFRQTTLKYCFEMFHVAIILNCVYMLVKHNSNTIFDQLSETIVVSTSKDIF